MSNLILFDFDGTLTREDTTRDLLYVLGRHRPIRVLVNLPRIMSLAFLRQRPERLQIVKCKVLASLMAGLSLQELAPLLIRFRKRVTPLLRDKVMERLQNHRDQGAHVLVVTASPRIVVEAVLEGAGVPVIGTEFLMNGSRLANGLEGDCCYGAAKVTAIANWRETNQVHRLVDEAWSDSLSDLPMMALAKRRFWVASHHSAQPIHERDPEATILDEELRAL